MDTAIRKEVLTTGEVAKICHVAPRTVSKWFDTGKLRGYRIPGSRDRRIPVDQLIAFMRAHSIPLDGLEGGSCRLLIVDSDVPAELTDALDKIERYQVMTAESVFDAGVLVKGFRPHVMVVNTDQDPNQALEICRNLKQHPDLQGIKVMAAVTNADDDARKELMSKGFDGCLSKPYSLREIIQAVEDATNLVR